MSVIPNRIALSGAVRNRPARATSVRPAEVWLLLLANAALIVGMWIRHGGIALLGSPQANLVAVGQLTALLGTYIALVQLVLMSRSPWIEQVFGLDKLANWHRWLGFSCINLICAHVVFSTAGYALGDRVSVVAEGWTLITTYPYVLMATVATALLVLIALTSLKAVRGRVKYETWHFIHYYTYLAIALAFGHELAVGFDLTTDPWARAYWIGLYLVVIGLVLAFRLGHPLRTAWRHDLRIAGTVQESPDTVSIYMTGRNLEQLQARAGQFFKWRFLTGAGWWKAHPFSLSALPNSQFVRITVKQVGDGSRDVQRLHVGTRVIMEGPYGVFTHDLQSEAKSLLIAGGIGITPLRAMLEEFRGGKNRLALIYRASSWEDVVLKREIDDLAASRRATVHYLVGRRGEDLSPNPLSAAALSNMVPDIGQRDVFICGPASLISEVKESLEILGLPKKQIHYERFALLG